MLPSAADKQRTLAYAATASLAAVTLVYVFGPTWFIDSSTSSKGRRKGVVGLVNNANHCFINSILQALAGLEELRTYLITRTCSARRNGELIEDGLTAEGKPILTAALKDILDKLNERPINRKTISAQPFLAVLEGVFQQRISRSQQDAHEFLQVVLETLVEEFHRVKRREKEVRRLRLEQQNGRDSDEEEEGGVVIITPEDHDEEKKEEVAGEEEEREEEDGGVPFEGKIQSEIECLQCHFKPEPTVSTFVVLTLPVPLKSSTTLNDCIDGSLSSEYIDDFQCAKCTLTHAISLFERKLSTLSPSSSHAAELRTAISKLTAALSDPEHPPPDIRLPPSNVPPRSRIIKRTQMSYHPPILTLHLSRSIYDPRYSLRKNSAKVAFPEKLDMGGIVDRRGYRLLCVVTHKGGHESGHYECFRRQIVHQPPYSTPTSSISPSPSPGDPGTPRNEDSVRLIGSPPPSLLSPEAASISGSISGSPISAPGSRAESISSKSDEKSEPNGSGNGTPLLLSPTETSRVEFRKKKLKPRHANRWWRISDEKVKEARTADVLGMQKEVYLLFYERDRGG